MKKNTFSKITMASWVSRISIHTPIGNESHAVFLAKYKGRLVIRKFPLQMAKGLTNTK